MLICFFLVITGNVIKAEDNYDQIVNSIIKINNEYPLLTEIKYIGKNDQNTNIIALKVSRNFNKSNHLIVATHHGNEIDTPLFAIQFIKDLLKINQGPLINMSFFIIPVLNISGYNNYDRYEINNNNDWIDPNRDYPDVCVPNLAYQLKSTKLLSDFIIKNDIISLVTVHGYIGTFTYPWGMYTNNYTSGDHDFFVELASKAVAYNGYEIGTHGGLIYPSSGGLEDWAYGYLGIWSMILELQTDPNLQQDSYAMLEFFSNVPLKRSNNYVHTGICL